MSGVSRRDFLESATLTAGVAGTIAKAAAAGESKGQYGGSERGGEALPTFRFALEESRGGHKTDGGSAKQATVEEPPVSKGLAGVSMRPNPGGIRELHWHPNAGEWQYIVRGRARIGVFGSERRARDEEFRQGDVGHVPRGYGHFIENVGDEPLRVLIGFNSGDYQEISLSPWLAANPEAIVADNFRIADAIVERLPKQRVFIAAKDGPGA